MMLPWFWLLWLILGLSCAGAGVWLTERRAHTPRQARASRGRLRCYSCGEPGEPGARFCGVCGCSVCEGPE